jgi:hypothetical protein
MKYKTCDLPRGGCGECDEDCEEDEKETSVETSER